MRARVVAIVLCGALLVAGLAWYLVQRPYVPAPPFTARRALATFAEHGVQVELALEQDARGTTVLVGTYTPLRPGEHLYSSELPRAGLSGMGRPTLLEIPAQPAARPLGPLVADQPTRFDPVPLLNATFPIYPDGPVTLRLPITVAADATQLTVQVTYMACSTNGYCMPPVEQKAVVLELGQPG